MLRLVGNGDQKKITRNRRHFSMQNSQENSKKNCTRVFWRVGKVRAGALWALSSLIGASGMGAIKKGYPAPQKHYIHKIILGESIFVREVSDTLNFLRHVMRAIWSVRPKCSHRCVSLKETPLKPVQILQHTTKNSTEQTVMRTKWFKHIAI